MFKDGITLFDFYLGSLEFWILFILVYIIGTQLSRIEKKLDKLIKKDTNEIE